MPALLEDDLYVKTRCSRIGTKSFDLSFSIFKKLKAETIEIANGLTVLVCYDYSKSQSVELPQEWKDWLAEENSI